MWGKKWTNSSIDFAILVLSQEIVSTPRSKFDRDIIKNKRLEETDIVINIRTLLFEMSEGG